MVDTLHRDYGDYHIIYLFFAIFAEHFWMSQKRDLCLICLNEWYDVLAIVYWNARLLIRWSDVQTISRRVLLITFNVRIIAQKAFKSFRRGLIVNKLQDHNNSIQLDFHLTVYPLFFPLISFHLSVIVSAVVPTRS